MNRNTNLSGRNFEKIHNLLRDECYSEEKLTAFYNAVMSFARTAVCFGNKKELEEKAERIVEFTILKLYNESIRPKQFLNFLEKRQK